MKELSTNLLKSESTLKVLPGGRLISPELLERLFHITHFPSHAKV